MDKTVDPQTPLAGVAIHHRIGPAQLDIQFEWTQPWTVLFGPSGSGKTTILRTICGLIRPDSGTIVVGAQRKALFDSTQCINLPPHERPFRMAAQAAHLFPNMSIRQNVRYGGGWFSKPRDEEQLVDELLPVFRLEDIAHLRPWQLSGGEQRRASVARAVFSATTSPYRGAFLLLDEPFNGIDAPVRDQLILDLKGWLQRWKIPALSVTHDVAEAFQLGAEVIKIADGKVVAQGPVEIVLAEERELLLKQLQP